MADVSGIVDGVMVVDEDGEQRTATVAEQHAAILRALEGQAVL